MKNIFYAKASLYTTEEALKKILFDFFKIPNAVISRTKNGKPYLENSNNLHFSVTHTKERIYIVFSENPIGIDAELSSRQPNYLPIVKKFPQAEREEINSTLDFLLHWLVKESAVKFLGGTLSHDLQKLCYVNKELTYEMQAFPAKTTILEHDEHLLAVCSLDDFKNAEFIEL